MAGYYLQEDGVSKFILEDGSGFYTLEGVGVVYTDSATITSTSNPSASDIYAHTPTTYTDAATVSSAVDISSSIEEHDTYDSETISSVTGIEVTETTITQTFTINEADTGLLVGDIVQFVVQVTETTTTTTSGSPTPPPTPPPPVSYAVSIPTTNYDGTPWLAVYNYNSGAAPTSGTVATFDDDTGILPVAGAS